MTFDDYNYDVKVENNDDNNNTNNAAHSFLQKRVDYALNN